MLRRHRVLQQKIGELKRMSAVHINYQTKDVFVEQQIESDIRYFGQQLIGFN